MKLLALVLIAVACLAASGGASRAASPVPRFVGCLNRPGVVRPPSILVACGDGGFFLTGLKWSSWTAASASARGTGHQNLCTPYCAAGHYRTYPVSVGLSRPRMCSGGRVEYTRFTFRFVAAKPPKVARGGTFKSPFFVGSGCP